MFIVKKCILKYCKYIKQHIIMIQHTLIVTDVAIRDIGGELLVIGGVHPLVFMHS